MILPAIAISHEMKTWQATVCPLPLATLEMNKSRI
jgi:hypothetical protein